MKKKILNLNSKKRIITAVLFAAIVFASLCTAISFTISAASFSGGSGTASDPYRIANVEDLSNVRNASSKYFVQVADISLQGVSFTPITLFSGTYDGAGYDISDFTLKSNSPRTGLFATNKGTIKNLNVTNCNISMSTTQTANFCGGIVGYADSGSVIENCTVSGSVTGKTMAAGAELYVAGIAGLNIGLVENCRNSASVTADPMSHSDVYAGGIVGNNNTTIHNCFNEGYIQAINGRNSLAGGIAAISFGTISSVRNEAEIYALSSRESEGYYCDAYAAGVVGYNKGILSYAQNIGEIYSKSTVDNANAGGITAYTGGEYTDAGGYVVEYSVNKGDVKAHSTAGESRVGGITATCYKGSYVRYCCNEGDVSALENVRYNLAIAGGVAGSLMYGTMIESCNHGAVTVSPTKYDSIVCGVANTTDAVMMNCYNTGNINRHSSYNYSIAAGIFYDSDTTCINSYNAGAVSVTGSMERVYGLYGVSGGKDRNNVQNCFTTITRNTGINNLMTAEKAKQKETYEGYDFETVWAIDPEINGGMPYLRNIPDENCSHWYRETEQIVHPSSIVISQTSLSLELGATAQLTATVLPENTDDKSIKWSFSSSNATVDQNGRVSANGVGRSNIYVTTADGKYRATCSVVVLDKTVTFAGGSGSETDPYLVATAEHLMNVAYRRNAHFLQIANISLDAMDVHPICNEHVPFTGSYDGNGYSISGLTLKKDDRACVGLFGSSGGVIKNVKMHSITVEASFDTATLYVGALIGINTGSVHNCHVNAVVKASVDGASLDVRAGGIVGHSSAAITDSSFSGEVHSEISVMDGNSYSGGIVGYGSAVTNSQNYGNICSVAYIMSDAYAGGIAGCSDGQISGCYNEGSIDTANARRSFSGGILGKNTAKVEACENVGEIHSSTAYNAANIDLYSLAAGISGSNFSIVRYCRNSGSIHAESTATHAYAGGVVGYNNGNAVLEKCKNTGTVKAGSTGGESRAGGIASSSHADSVVRYCCNSGDISVYNNPYYWSGESGGIVAVLQYGSLYQCCNHGKVSTDSNAYEPNGNGIAHYTQAKISDCYCDGDLYSSFTRHETYNNGRLCGIGSGSNTPISNSYFAGNITSKYSYTSKYGLIHTNGQGGNTVNNCYAYKLYSGTEGTTMTADAAKLQETYKGFDFTNVWGISSDVNDGRPYLKNIPSDDLPYWYLGIKTQPSLNGHNEGEWIVDVAPSCTSEGSRYKKCTECGTILKTEQIAATGHDYNSVVTAPTCTEKGYTTHTCVCGDSYVDDYVEAMGHSYKDISCTACGVKHPNAVNYKGKVISILGDSISTFAGYIPTADGFNLEHLSRYPQDNLLTDVNETWWMQIMVALDTKLGINDSWRGATVSGAHAVTTGSTGENAAMHNLTRIQNLGSNGTPDVILFYGGTNDLAHVSKVGTFNAATAPTAPDLTTQKWDNLADGYANTLLRLCYYYPDAQIICLLPTYTASYYSNDKLAQGNAVLAEICDHYGIPYVDLRHCGISVSDLPDGIHPNAAGMDYITDVVLEVLLNECDIKQGENKVYSVSHALDGVKASKSYYKGVSAGAEFEETIEGENISVTVTMDGKDITAEVYKDGKISISSVTGEIVVIAIGEKKPIYADYIEELPEKICCGTNIWSVLKHNNEYYTASGWGLHASGVVRSVTFKVTEGDRIFATSFGKAGQNGTAATNGIRVTFFGENGYVNSISADMVYSEFAANGYITVPEDATVVSIPMWNESDENEIYLLSRAHDYISVVTCPTCTEQGYTTHTCASCGDFYVDNYVDATGHSVVIDPALKATSADSGVTEGSHCAICEKILQEQKEIPAKGYDWMIEDGVFKLLLIGNSFSEDASSCGQGMTESQLLNILQAMLGDDVEIIVGLAYSGGKGLNWHATQADQGLATHSLRVISSNGRWSSKGSMVLCDALEWTDWDMVSLQHYGLNVSKGEESVPYPEQTDEKFYKLEVAAEYLLDYVDKYAPQADVYFYMHWARTSSIALNAGKSTYDSMAGYLPIVMDYVGTESGNRFTDFIPVGLSIQNARTTYLALLAYNTTAYADKNLNLKTDAQIGLQRDGGHVSFNIGRYIAGLTFAEILIPEELRAEGYILPEIRVTESVGRLPYEYTEIAQKAVHAAVESWRNGSLDVTEIEGYAEDPTVAAKETLENMLLTIGCEGADDLENHIISKVLAALPEDFAVEDILLNEENAVATVKLRFGYTFVSVELPYSIQEHSYKVTVTPPTCTEQGYTTHTCHCGDSYVDTYVDALGHSFGEWVETKAPTCTEAGSERRDCTNCDHFETREVAATGHDYKSVVTAPTCTERGYTTHTCHCGDSYVDTYVDALGHSFGNWIVVTEPTCTEKGSERRDCANCDHFETREVAATGHSHTSVVTAPTCTEQGYTTHTCHCGDSYVDTYVDALGHSFGEWVETKAPTCTEKGSERRDCERCDHFETREVAAAGHSYTDVVTAPTCTEKGYTTHTCHCGDSYVDNYVDALGHSFGEWVETKAPTCTEAGSERRDCANCDHFETREVAATGHDYSAVVTAPTCTEKGYTTHTCHCGDSYVDNYVDALGHSFGEWIETKAPTCTEKGEERRDCERCDHFETREVAAAGHSYTDVVTAPTCTEKGYTTHTCHCGDSYVDNYVDALGHSFGEWIETKAPTCTEKGSERRDCERCDHFETREVAATGHSHTSVVTAPTCTEQGYTTHTCHCGDSYVDTYVDALGHSFGEWVETKAPTCTETGSERRDCERCDHFETREVAATGHDYTSVFTAPTCTEKGYTTHTCHCGDSYVDTYVDALGHSFGEWVETKAPTCTAKGEERRDCERCDHFETREVAAEGHSYTDVVTAPTCTEKGYTTHTCHCGDSYVDTYVDALGHSFGEWIETKAPTCTEAGSERRDCERCEHFETREIEATGHDYTAVFTAPTCTENGYTTHTCHCGDSYVDSYVDAFGHSFGDWVETKAPTCTEAGSERRDCANCDHFETREVAAAGHSYTDVVTAPTCTENGYTTHTCHCGDSYVDTYVDALGHSFGEWVETKAPTCTEAGSERRDCANCDHFETREVAAAGHNYTDVVTAPTCTEQGYTTHTCHCGDSYVDTYVDALDHSFGEWVETKAPTCTEAGSERRDCANCDHFETREVVATGHSYTDVVTAPTCTEKGYTTHTCHCGDSYVDTYVDATGHEASDWIIDQPAEVGVEGKKHKECVICHELLEEATIEALPPEEKPTEKPTEQPTTDGADATDATDATQDAASSSDKPSENEGGCGSALLPMSAVIILSMLAAAPTFLKRKREE